MAKRGVIKPKYKIQNTATRNNNNQDWFGSAFARGVSVCLFFDSFRIVLFYLRKLR